MIYGILTALGLGAIQAITEFLPISSSAHLLIAPWLVGIPNPGLAFDAALHIGTSVALVWFFWADFIKIWNEKSRLLKFIIIASIPGGVIGFLGEKVIDKVFHQGDQAIIIVALGMILTTLIIWIIDKRAADIRRLEQITQSDAILIGIGQALALIPGVSRSGSTIAAGLALGFKRDAAARFSFLIGTPIALGAGLYKSLGIISSNPSSSEILNMIIGISVSAILGFIVIGWLLDYLKQHDLKVFLIYRLIFASLVLIVLGLRLYG